jgi:hypothetical protein
MLHTFQKGVLHLAKSNIFFGISGQVQKRTEIHSEVHSYLGNCGSHTRQFQFHVLDSLSRHVVAWDCHIAEIL